MGNEKLNKEIDSPAVNIHKPLSAEEIARRAILRFLFTLGREESVGAVHSFASRKIRKKRIKMSDLTLYFLVLRQIELAAERGAIVMFEEQATRMVALPQNRTQPVLFAAPGL